MQRMESPVTFIGRFLPVTKGRKRPITTTRLRYCIVCHLSDNRWNTDRKCGATTTFRFDFNATLMGAYNCWSDVEP